MQIKYVVAYISLLLFLDQFHFDLKWNSLSAQITFEGIIVNFFILMTGNVQFRHACIVRAKLKVVMTHLILLQGNTATCDVPLLDFHCLLCLHPSTLDMCF